MDWNEMKDELRKVKAPECQSDRSGPSAGAIDDLIGRLKTHAAQEQSRLRQARLLFLIATVIMGFTFVGVCLLPPGPLSLPRTVHRGVLFLVFCFVTFGLWKRLWELSQVDYTQAAQSFLDAAEQRYVFMRPKDYVIMACGLVLFGIASAPYVVGILLARYLPRERESVAVAVYVLFYLLVCAMGLYFTRRNWKREKAPLLEEIHRMKRSLENSGTARS